MAPRRCRRRLHYRRTAEYCRSKSRSSVSMRRHVQLLHLAQARSGPLGRRVTSQPPSAWPDHIKLAWAILRDELQVTKRRAFRVMVDSISAAQTCAAAVNRRSRNIVEAQSRAKVAFAFKRLANCCRRASAGLRRRLDEA